MKFRIKEQEKEQGGPLNDEEKKQIDKEEYDILYS